ncbi:MAG: SPOR domain-containing protein, partial [Draconibacterium sp.]|nr:SPOR domain-containing protein [Draconibacterium sp.]
ISLDSFGLEVVSLTIEEEKDEEEPAVILTPDTENNVTDETTELAESLEDPEQETESVSIPEPITQANEEKKKKRGWLWLLLILIPLIAVSVFIFMKDKQPEQPVQERTKIQKEPEEEKPLITLDTITEDTAKVMEKDTVIAEIQKPKTNDLTDPSKTKFYLVGGSFKSEENAETFLQELKAKGFEPYHLGKYGNFFIVGLGTYNSEREASLAKREYLNKNPGSGVWILER